MTKTEYENASKERATCIEIEKLDSVLNVVADGNNLTDLIVDHKIVSTGDDIEVWLKVRPETIYTALSATTKAMNR